MPESTQATIRKEERMDAVFTGNPYHQAAFPSALVVDGGNDITDLIFIASMNATIDNVMRLNKIGPNQTPIYTLC